MRPTNHLGTAGLDAPIDDYGDSFESLMRDHTDRAARVAAANHEPRRPRNDNEARLNTYGEDLLAHVTDLNILELLFEQAAYIVNRDLRRPSDAALQSFPSSRADYSGINGRQIVDKMDSVFRRISNSNLPAGTLAFRGQRIAKNEMPSPGTIFTDPGYMFATLDKIDALAYASDCTNDHLYGTATVHSPVIWELDVRRALFIPSGEAQSREFVQRRFVHNLLETAIPQFIVNRGSRWQIGEVTIDTNGLTHIMAVQDID